jgi:hypothetical protein
MIKYIFAPLNMVIKNTSEAPKGKQTYYRCGKCGSVISSIPHKNIGCECGNIFIDKDYFRLSVEDYSKFEVGNMIEDKGNK